MTKKEELKYNLKMEQLLTSQLFDLDTCLEIAYNEIKDRKGQTLNGTFIKDETI